MATITTCVQLLELSSRWAYGDDTWKCADERPSYQRQCNCAMEKNRMRLSQIDNEVLGRLYTAVFQLELRMIISFSAELSRLEIDEIEIIE